MNHGATATLRPATRAWLWGGSAILASGLLRLLQAVPIAAMIGRGPVTLMAATTFALGLAVLAIGVRGQGSIVARRRSGMLALFVIAGIEVAQGVVVEVFRLIPPGMRDGVMTVSNLLLLLQFAASVVAVIVIFQAGAVPVALRWFPIVVLAIALALHLMIRIGLGERGSAVSQGMDFFVLVQVGLALLDAALGFAVMLASPRAAGRNSRPT